MEAKPKRAQGEEKATEEIMDFSGDNFSGTRVLEPWSEFWNSLSTETHVSQHLWKIKEKKLITEASKALFEELDPNPVQSSYILKRFGEDKIRRIRKDCISFPAPLEAKGVRFKILNKIYLSNEFFSLRVNFDVNNCGFCWEPEPHFLLLSCCAFYHFKHIHKLKQMNGH